MPSPKVLRVLRGELKRINKEMAALERKRRDLSDERDEVSAMLGTPLPARGPRLTSSHSAPDLSNTKIHEAMRRTSGFGVRIEGGPTDALLRVLRENPDGLTFTAAVKQALPDVQSNAKNKEKSVGNVLLKLKGRGLVQVRDGKYFAA